MGQPAPPAGGDIDQCISAFVAALDAGERPDPAAWCRARPDLAPWLGERLEDARGIAEALGCGAGSAPPCIGDYRVVRTLGQGGMGVVYLAEQPSLGRRVAIKMLPRAAALDPRQVERFRREIRALGSLVHPAIVAVHDAGEWDGRLYYAMEYVEGATVAELASALCSQPPSAITLERVRAVLGAPAPAAAGPTDPTLFHRPDGDLGYVAFVTAAFAGFADALAAAHAQGIIHRDVTPRNLMIDRGGRPRLFDFGLSCLDDRSAGGAGSTFAGTPVYMSPEQILAGRVALDARTDVYSLGASLYEALALAPPFAGESLRELFRRIQWEDPPPLRSRNARVPDDLAAVVAVAMEKNPDHRYPTAAEFAADLRRVLLYQAVRARGASRWSRLARRLRRHRARVLTSCAFALVVAAGAAFLQSERAETRALLERQAGERQQRALAEVERVGEDLAARRFAAVAELLARANSAPPEAPLVAARLRLLEGDARAAVESLCERARSAIAAEAPGEAVALLAPLAGTPFENEEARGLAEEARALDSAGNSARTFGSPSREVRITAISDWLRDRQAGRGASAEGDRLAEILRTETDLDVLSAALEAVVTADYASFAPVLAERFATTEPDVASLLAQAGAAAGDGLWRERIESRRDDLMRASASGWRVNAGTIREHGVSLGEAPLLGESTNVLILRDGVTGPDVVTGSTSRGSATPSARWIPSLCAFYLEHAATLDFVHEAGARILVDGDRAAAQRDSMICAAILEQLDDPRGADLLYELAAAAAARDPAFTVFAARTLARWEPARALALLDPLVGRNAEYATLPFAALEAAGWGFRDPRVIEWATRIVGDPAASRYLKLALLEGIAVGPRATVFQLQSPLLRDLEPAPRDEQILGGVLAGLGFTKASVLFETLRATSRLRDERDRSRLAAPIGARWLHRQWVGFEADRASRAKAFLAAVPDTQAVALTTPAAVEERKRLFGNAASLLSNVLRGIPERALSRVNALARTAGPAECAELERLAREHPVATVRRQAAVHLLCAADSDGAAALVQAAADLLGSDPDAERMLALHEVRAGRLDEARARVDRLRREWLVTDSFFALPEFETLALAPAEEAK